MDKFDWILILIFLQVLLTAGVLLMLVLFWIFLQGFAAASHATILLPLLL